MMFWAIAIGFYWHTKIIILFIFRIILVYDCRKVTIVINLFIIGHLCSLHCGYDSDVGSLGMPTMHTCIVLQLNVT